MSHDFELFVSLAEIAGVFVAFGALITLTRRSESTPIEEALLRFVVAIGLVVVVAALVPITLSRYGFADRSLWALSSGISLLIIWFGILAALRSHEHRDAMLADARANPVFALFF